MLLSIGHGEFPDLNFRLAPSCHIEGKNSILIMNRPLKQPTTQKAFSPIYFFENTLNKGILILSNTLLHLSIKLLALFLILFCNFELTFLFK